jgi:hypothetical protein
MINNYTKLAASIALMWLLPHCAKKSPPAKTIDSSVALSVQQDCLIMAIEKRLSKLEAQTIQTSPTRAKIVAISSIEAVHE